MSRSVVRWRSQWLFQLSWLVYHWPSVHKKQNSVKRGDEEDEEDEEDEDERPRSLDVRCALWQL